MQQRDKVEYILVYEGVFIKIRPIPMQRTTLFILIFIVALLIWVLS